MNDLKYHRLVGSVGPHCENFPTDVRVVQSFLSQAGLYAGASHGRCDMQTIYAIRRYQSNFMYSPDGRICTGNETWKRISKGVPYKPCGAYDCSVVVPTPVEAPPKKEVISVVTEAEMNSYLGKHIRDICPIQYVGLNNCAHFVAHVLKIQVGLLCDLKSAENPKHNPDCVSVRCDEIYNTLNKRDLWSSMNFPPEDGMLVFVCPADYVLSNKMTNRPKKHVGILCAGKVYNYSNSTGKVIADASPEAFLKKFRNPGLYGPKAELFYGLV